MADQRKCPECQGTGEVPCNMEYDDMDHPDNCPICGGNPKVRMPCTACEGTGKVDD